MKTNDVICGDGMCPFIPCKDCPSCKHFRELKDIVIANILEN